MDEMSRWNRPHYDGRQTSYATQPAPAPASASGRVARGRGKVLRWAAAVAAALALAAAGTIVGLGLGGGSSQAAPDSGQAAVLSAALTGTSGALGGTAAPGQAAGLHARHLARLLRHLRGIHGEFTVAQRGGGFREIAFERGVVVAVSGQQLTVRAADGTTWTWTVGGDTVVVKDRAKSAVSAIATGDRVFAGGPEQGAVRHARLIVIPAVSGQSRSGPAASGPGTSTG